MPTTEEQGTARRRSGADTRREAQRVALDLFTRQGYEATSLRQIADALGINKASLYYHFPGKEAILRSLLEERGSEAERLLEWLDAQPVTPPLLEEAVLRWVDSFSAEKLAGIRFLRANPLIARVLDAEGDARIGDPLARFADRIAALVPASPERVLLVRMAVLGINAAVEAAVGTDVDDADVVAAARAAARALVAEAQRPVA
jgi:AcrR family transcriptional regulator